MGGEALKFAVGQSLVQFVARKAGQQAFAQRGAIGRHALADLGVDAHGRHHIQLFHIDHLPPIQGAQVGGEAQSGQSRQVRAGLGLQLQGVDVVTHQLDELGAQEIRPLGFAALHIPPGAQGGQQPVYRAFVQARGVRQLGGAHGGTGFGKALDHIEYTVDDLHTFLHGRPSIPVI